MAYGAPEFDYGDVVVFTIEHDGEEIELEGTVEIIDAYGTFFDPDHASYDILVVPDPFYGGDGCLYKHISEERVHPA